MEQPPANRDPFPFHIKGLNLSLFDICSLD